MAKKNPVQVQVAVTLNPAAYEFLEKNANGDMIGTLAGWCGYWADQQARGGIMLDPNDHAYLAELSGGKKFRDSRALVAAVEKGLKRDGGAFSFRVNVDPAHVQPLNEQAAISGMTVEELINGVVNMCMTNGWLWDFSPVDGRQIPFTADMLKSTAELCGKSLIDSSDIAGLIAEERFLPIDRETKQLLADVSARSQPTASDLKGILNEVKALRAQVREAAAKPRELVMA